MWVKNPKVMTLSRLLSFRLSRCLERSNLKEKVTSTLAKFITLVISELHESQSKRTFTR
jgi:hypothetical protein